MLIDAHCHLGDEQFTIDLDAVIARAQAAGVSAIITAGVDVESSRAAIALAERYEIVYAVVGIHPEHATTFDEASGKAIRQLASHRKVVGIGECGLDYYRNLSPRSVSIIVKRGRIIRRARPRNAHSSRNSISRQNWASPSSFTTATRTMS